MSNLSKSTRRVGAVFATTAIGSMLVATVAMASTLDRIREQGYLRMGFANETPFSYATPEGTLAGVDVDILKNILEKMGVSEVDGGLTTFGSLIPGLQAERFDLVSSAIYIRPDRCAQVSFAEPLYILGDTVIVPAGNPKGINSYADIASNPELKIGYPTGGTGILGNAEAMGVNPAQMIGFPDGPSGFEAIKAGRIDGYATTSMVGETQLRQLQDPSLERADPFEQPVVDGEIKYGIASFAVRKDDADLLAEINKHLMEMRGSPEYMEILGKHGLTEADLPDAEITTAKICGVE